VASNERLGSLTATIFPNRRHVSNQQVHPSKCKSQLLWKNTTWFGNSIQPPLFIENKGYDMDSHSAIAHDPNAVERP